MKVLGRKLAVVLIVIAISLSNPGTALAAEAARDIYAQDNISRNTISLRGRTEEKAYKMKTYGEEKKPGERSLEESGRNRLLQKQSAEVRSNTEDAAHFEEEGESEPETSAKSASDQVTDGTEAKGNSKRERTDAETESSEEKSGKEESGRDDKPGKEMPDTDVEQGKEKADADAKPGKDKSDADAKSGKEEFDADAESGKEQSDANAKTGTGEADGDAEPGKEESDAEAESGREESDADMEAGKKDSDMDVESGKEGSEKSKSGLIEKSNKDTSGRESSETESEQGMKDRSEAEKEDKTALKQPSSEESRIHLPNQENSSSDAAKESRKNESSMEKPKAASSTEERNPKAAAGILKSANPSARHNVTMPDRTSHYFLLQKESDQVADVSESDVKIVTSEKEAAQYIFSEYPDGRAYNFSPTMTEETEVRVGGGSGGSVSLENVKNGVYEEFGELIQNTQKGFIVSRVFDLNRCSTAPYAIYTNVGSWFDTKTKKSYKVDMKMSVTGALYPGEETRKELYSDKLTAPYVGFTNFNIGIITSRTDDVDVSLDFFYHGTEEKIEDIKGILEFIDIDAQQGVDFGSGIEKVILFNTGSSLMQYAPGLISDSKGYVSSQTKDNLDMNNMDTTVMGLFSGNGVKCRFTLSKCDHLDTGGRAKYAVDGGYGIPVANSLEEAICYYYANSTGFMGIRTDIKLIAPPDSLQKSVYQGTIDGEKSDSPDRTLLLRNIEEPLTFVLTSGVNMTPDTDAARYKSFVISDRIDSILQVTTVKVFAASASGAGGGEKEDVSSLFKISLEEAEGKGTDVTVTAQPSVLKEDRFYGRVYYVHIGASVKNEEDLKKEGISLEDYYQEDNRLAETFEDQDFRGTYSVDNSGRLRVSDQFDLITEKESPPSVVTLAVRIGLKKLDEESGSPVKGVVFGLFPGKDVKEYSGKDAICLAETNEQGVAVLKTGDKGTFFQEKYGDGPYCIKEVSVPDSMQYVWEVNRSWVYTIPSLKELKPGELHLEKVDRSRTLTNKNRVVPKDRVKVYKSCRDTGELVKGAVFALSQWSEKKQEYQYLLDLVESRDALGRLVYTNNRELVCTMDNLGRFKIQETQAPKGCILTGQEWTFLADGSGDDEGHEFFYEQVSSKKQEKGHVICRNPLQKAILNLLKQDDEGKYVEGVSFQIIAAEDIYAPWNLDEKGKPLPGAEALTAKGTLVDQITTGKDGKGRSTQGKELYIGSYEIKEVTGAKDHVMGKESYFLTMTYGSDQTEKYLTYQLLANNSIMQPSFAVAKMADKTRNPEGKAVKFNSDTGRYVEKKSAGQYAAGEKIDFTIHITNTGNTPLYQLEVTDDMDKINKEYGYSLSRFINMDTASFQIPDSGYVKTRKGEKVRVYFLEKSRLKVMISRLNVADSIELHVLGQVLHNARDAYQLENEVFVSARYNNREGGEEGHLVDVPVEYLLDSEGKSLVRDQDYLQIPGRPGSSVLKMADRTSGIRISNGEMLGGSKVPGIYKAGEKVNFHIIVKNTGTARLKNIHVKDVMSQRLAAVTDSRTASFILGDAGEKEKELVTFSGKTVRAKLLQPNELLLCSSKDEKSGEDRLYSGDYVEVIYQATLLRDVANMYDLSNDVMVNSVYFDGESDRQVIEGRDRDKIEVPGQTEAKTAKLADRTKGAVLDQGRYRADSKISGVYESGSQVTYKITVTNSGTANLYRLILTDRLSPALQQALDLRTVSFKAGNYRTLAGRTIRSRCLEPQVLMMDFLAAGDSVEVFLQGKILKKQGNLFDLENTVTLEASSITGNEEEIRHFEEQEKKEQKSYSLTYHSNWEKKEKEKDGETPCKAAEVVHVNGCSFDRKDYLFAGWNTEPDGSGDSYGPDALFTMPERNVDLYAQWSRKPVDTRKEKNSRLIYDSNNTKDQKAFDGENPGLPGSIFTVDENHFLYEGWTFVGWNTKKDGSGEGYSFGDAVKLPDHDLYLYAQWLKNSAYTLTYDANNGSGVKRMDSETPCARASVVHLDGNDFVYEEEGKSYKFQSWNSRPDGSGDALMPGDTKEMNTDVILYAQWEERPADDDGSDLYHLFYHANNGTVDYSVDAQTPAGEGKKIGIDENRFSFGLSTFQGWNTKADGSGKSYEGGNPFTMPDHDVHLYAQWKNHSVRLIYHANIDREKEDLTVEDAQTPAAVKSSVQTDGVMFENTGYHFSGWNEKADGSGKSYRPGEKVCLEKDKHLYAQWTLSQDKYRMIYHSSYPSEGKGGGHNDQWKNLSETDGETPCFSHTIIGVNENLFSVPDDYRFIGWNTKADGSGISCQPEDHYVMPAADVHLYAQWLALDFGDSGQNDAHDSGVSSDDRESDRQEEADDKKEAPNPNLPSAKDYIADVIEQEYRRVESSTFDKVVKEAERAMPIPVTEEMTDQDHINIPGKGEGRVAKLADRTEGVSFSEGRYKGNRIPGIYTNGDTVDFSVTVTNSGTADLYDILVKDLISEDLRKYLDEKTLVYTTGKVISMNKDKISVSEVSGEEDAITLKLDHLKTGDQLLLHLSAKVTGVSESLSGLVNNVHITGKYVSLTEDGKKTRIYFDDTEKCHDTEVIGVGAPVLVVSKLADRTRGVLLKDGRFSGIRRHGTYRPGDPVTFTIRVTNRGSSPAVHVTVDDIPSSKLSDLIHEKGFTYSAKDALRSVEGHKVRLEKAESGKLVLDRLEGGDSFLVYYFGTIKKGAVSAVSLVNKVTVGGSCPNGEEIEKTELMQDSDQINIAVEKTKEKRKRYASDSSSHKRSDPPAYDSVTNHPRSSDREEKTSSSVKTGDSSQPEKYIVLTGLSLLLILMIAVMNRKFRN